METINFYSTHGDHGCFSNFYFCKIKIYGHVFSTSEHAFQSQKFAGTKYETKVRDAKGPKQAAELGRDRSLPLRKDWESAKDNVMYEVVLAKFSQHEDLKKILLGTGDAKLVEHTERDSYWGDGGNGSGKNKLGQTLMRVRAEISK